MKELFEVEGELRPCSNEVMLAGMLGVLRDSHWCAVRAVVRVCGKQHCMLGVLRDSHWCTVHAVVVTVGRAAGCHVFRTAGPEQGGWNA